IGAFTKQLGDLDLLFHAGIPVWYICRVKNMPYVRIDSVAPLLCEDYSQQLIRPDGFVVDCSNTTPPHKIIYNGVPNRPDHFQKMGEYLDSLLNDAPLFLGVQGSADSLTGR
ncbi:hypothetical protein GYMLUDRAFT_104434, partial [Collybiopsis luxurians FD-317 M1]